MKIITGFFMAWGNFCAIPCPCKKWDEKARKQMLVMFPVIGLIIGALWYALFLLLKAAGIPVPLSAALMTAYPFLASGFIHLDGFMDCNDAILSRRPLEERQRILKDSRVGAFAVITAILLFMVFFAAMWSLIDQGGGSAIWCLVLAPVLARALPARDIMAMRPLSTSQYEQSFEDGKNQTYKWVLTAIWLVAALALLTAGRYLDLRCGGNAFQAAGVMAAAQLAVALISGAYARKQLGGMSGDIAGYMLIWSELAAVVSLSVM